MKKLLLILVIITSLFVLNSCNKTGSKEFENDNLSGGKNVTATVALDWYKLQLAILLQRNTALNGNAYFGYIGIALYESVRNGMEHSVSLSTKLYQMPAMPAKENNKSYNWQVSANAAMAKIVRSLYAGLTPANLASIDSLENAYNQKLKLTTSTTTFNRSQSYGQSVATAIYNWYLTDNVNATNTGYIPPVFPGSWVPTPPAFANPPVNPYLGKARTFLAADLTGVTPPFPATYSEAVGSDFYKIEKQVYDVSQTLTTEQKNIALFFVDQGNGIGYTPAGHDMGIVTQAIAQTGANLYVAAEAYAKAGIAERDGAIECFRSKYTYNLIRPVTYIRKLIDPNWLPFIATPAHPEYPAAHAFITGSVMQSATRVLGNHVKFTDHSYDFRGYQSRTYDNIFAAAEEAAISRLYGGIHTVPSLVTGLLFAKDIGNKVGDLNLYGDDDGHNTGDN